MQQTTEFLYPEHMGNEHVTCLRGSELVMLNHDDGCGVAAKACIELSRVAKSPAAMAVKLEHCSTAVKELLLHAGVDDKQR